MNVSVNQVMREGNESTARGKYTMGAFCGFPTHKTIFLWFWDTSEAGKTEGSGSLPREAIGPLNRLSFTPETSAELGFFAIRALTILRRGRSYAHGPRDWDF